jgi:hypothetical protein
MRNRLTKPNPLPHSLAIRSDFTIGSIKQVDSFQSNLGQLVGGLSIVSMNVQK